MAAPLAQPGTTPRDSSHHVVRGLRWCVESTHKQDAFLSIEERKHNVPTTKSLSLSCGKLLLWVVSVMSEGGAMND